MANNSRYYPRQRERIDREDLLFVPERLEKAMNDYGKASHIKRHVDTTAKEYEIRTAIRYWFGGKPTYRTSDVLWHQLHAVENLEKSPEEVLEVAVEAAEDE